MLLGAVLEGEVVLLVAGHLAHQGHLSLAGVAAFAALGGTRGVAVVPGIAAHLLGPHLRRRLAGA